MKAILLDTTYKYDKVTLPTSGVEVSGIVVIRSGKIYMTDGKITCKQNKRTFNFSLNRPNHELEMVPTDTELEFTAPTYATPAWPAGLSIDATVEEFKQFVITDINS